LLRFETDSTLPARGFRAPPQQRRRSSGVACACACAPENAPDGAAERETGIEFFEAAQPASGRSCIEAHEASPIFSASER
jgi:hypothetical protein